MILPNQFHQGNPEGDRLFSKYLILATHVVVEEATKKTGFRVFEHRQYLKHDERGKILEPFELTPRGRDELASLAKSATVIVLSTEVKEDRELGQALANMVCLARITPKVRFFELLDGENQDAISEKIKAAILGNGEPVKPVEVEDPDPFPTVALPEPMRGLVEAVAKGLNCDPSGPGLAALVTAAAGIGAAIRVTIHPGWEVPVNLFGCILGYSGSRKSAVTRPFVKPFLKVHRERRAAFEEQKERVMEALEIFEKKRKEAFAANRSCEVMKPKSPKLANCFVEDATLPALVRVLADNPRGVLCFRDELTAWLKSFDQFSDRGGSDLQSWINIFNGGSITVNRKANDEHIFIENSFACVLGSIQPGILKNTQKSEHKDSGLFNRILFVKPERFKKVWVEYGIPEAVTGQWDDLIRRLMEIPFREDEDGTREPNRIGFEPEAKKMLIGFLEWLYDQQNSLDESDPRCALLSRFEELCPRLCGVFHLVESAWAGNAIKPINPVAVEAGIELSKWFLRERGRVEIELGFTPKKLEDRQLLEFLKSGPKSLRDLKQFRSAFHDEKVCKAAIKDLVGSDGSWMEISPGPKGGRKTEKFVLHEFSQNSQNPRNPSQES